MSRSGGHRRWQRRIAPEESQRRHSTLGYLSPAAFEGLRSEPSRPNRQLSIKTGGHHKPATLAIGQIKALVARLPPEASAVGAPLFVFDAGDDVASFAQALTDLLVSLLIRSRGGRCCSFEPDPAPQPKIGRPERHGATFVRDVLDTWPEPTATLRRGE